MPTFSSLPSCLLLLLMAPLCYALSPCEAMHANETDGQPLGEQRLQFREYLGDASLSDAKIRCSDDTVPVSKLLLAASSQVFKNKFAHNKSPIIEMKSLNSKSLKIMLHYIYAGEVPAIPEDLLQDIYSSSNQYALHGLKKACSQQLAANLNVLNFVETFEKAETFNDDYLKNKVVSFILNNEKILQSGVWLKFSTDRPDLAVAIYQKVTRNGRYSKF